MADYPTSSYSPKDALKAYQDILASEKRKKKYATLIDGMMKLSPRYSGSTAETHNRTLRDSYGTSGSTGFATYSRLKSEAADAEIDKFFMQDYMKQDFRSEDGVMRWGATMGSEMTREKLAEFVELYIKGASEERAVAGEERAVLSASMTREDWLKGKAVDKLSPLFVDKYTNQYRNRTAEDQEGVIARIQDEIMADENIPSTAKRDLIELVIKGLTDKFGGRGETLKKGVARTTAAAVEARAVDAAERDRKTFERNQLKAITENNSDLLASRLAEEAARLMRTEGMGFEEALQKVKGESQKLYKSQSSREGRELARDRLEKLVGKPESKTYTRETKRTREVIEFLTPTGDDATDLRQAQIALESERQGMAELNPAWHTYGAAAQSGIAVQNFLRVLRIADNTRLAQLDALREDFDEHILQFSGDAIEVESARYMDDAVKELRLPRLVIEFILFPEKFEFGKKG